MQKFKCKTAIDIFKLDMIFFLFYEYLKKNDAHLLRDEG